MKETSEELEEKKKALNDFFEKWGGFFATAGNGDDERYNYLQEKYK